MDTCEEKEGEIEMDTQVENRTAYLFPRGGDQTSIKRLFFKARFSGFLLIGGLIFLIGLAIIFLLVSKLHINKILAGVITTVITVELNFLLNRYLNWGDRSGKFINLWWKFHVIRLGTIILNQVLYIMLIVFGVQYIIATIIAVGIVTILNYFGNDRFVFNKERREKSHDNSTP